MGAAIASFATVAQAQNTIEVSMDGTPVYFTGPGPMLVGGTPMIPLRGALESAGGTVVWDPISHTATGQKDQTDFQVTIGSSTAMIEGASYNMGAPAMLYQGRTFVPASFIGEALGTNAQYLSSEQRVVFSNIVAEEPDMTYSTPMPDTVTETVYVTEPTTTYIQEPAVTETIIVQEPVRISTFTVDAEPWLSPGDRVTIHMVGTPGLNATARVAGISDEVVLYEREPGHYYGTWIVPSGSDIYLPEARVTGYLRNVQMDAEPFMLDWNDTFVVDTSMPIIRSITPDDDAMVNADRVRVMAEIDDSGSGFDERDVRFYVNGIDRTTETRIDNGHLMWTARPEDVSQKMKAELFVRDRAGNETSRTWTFFTNKSDWYDMGHIKP
jgi:hypothetical protein